MQFEVEDRGSGVAIVRAVGKLNLISAPVLRSVVTRAIADHGNRIVVDLAGVEFIDSSGLGALVGCLKAARQADGDLRIARPTDQVLMVLRLSSLDRVLASYASPDEAYGV
ncbi:STAS domain-containing protein [Microbacterium sp. LWH3-1.2]|uniref:STAS domain-containing protein n=1 Tax=Microbacterium sp. LWH3-1.2 TaxID=3135256 RepID=UPI00343AFFCE